ncbi:unnamed protein product, partial [Mesorhabditis belari]|uniref:Vacuolar protein sorting-associated protein 35 n=1 Tax=Mesorhabditis belari TaxID=2138241 RepID=A0AAF3ESF0_9BILA
MEAMRIDDTNSVEQEKFLETAVKTVKAEAFEMKRSLDKSKRMDALKHASIMLAELRTGLLTPKYYYRLYIDVVNELNHLESFLLDELEKEKKEESIAELYEHVQYAGTIIPRMYLMITVGVVYMKLMPQMRAELLNDLVEMSRGVQHPLRGLFLRHYLLQVTKSLLPDAAEGVEPAIPGSGTVRDTIDFIKLNFSEMNKLWVRQQHQGPSKEREKRERERMELRILVGTNLVRLSQLEHLTQEVYEKEVLPSILEQVVSCRDPISQEYLMECVIQVFADEFHLATLNEFLASCKELAQEVHIKNVLIALIDRLSLYVSNAVGSNIREEIQLFEIFSAQAEGLIQSRSDMPIEDIVSLHTALVSLAVKCYGEKLAYANTVFLSLANNLKDKQVEGIDMYSHAGKELIRVLRVPVDEYKDVLRVALLTDYPRAMLPLNYRGRCTASAFILQNLIDNETGLKSTDDIDAVCSLIECLLSDQPDQPEDAHDSEEFADELNLIASMIHLIKAEDRDVQFLLLNGLRKRLGAGGKWRIRKTLPPIIFSIYELALNYQQSDGDENWDMKVRKMFVCAMGTIGALITTGEMTQLPLNLYLEGAIVANRIKFSENAMVVYEFISKALSVLEDEIADSRERLSALALVTNSVLKVDCLASENWEPLVGQIILAGSKMFKKADQVRTLCSAASLYWKGKVAESEGELRNGNKVTEILKKSAKVAAQCMEPLVQQQLFVHLLNQYYYFYEDGCTVISPDVLSELISRTRDAAIQLEPSREADDIDQHLQHTLQHIRNTKDKYPELAEKLQI